MTSTSAFALLLPFERKSASEMVGAIRTLLARFRSMTDDARIRRTHIVPMVVRI